MDDLISVVMPVRDGGRWLRTAVDSILAQRGVRLELIVVDDHSSDEALAALPRDPRLRLLATAGRGVVDALNTGAAAARGEWLARMDADDEALPGRLQVQIAYLKAHSDVGICGTGVEIFRDDAALGDGYRRYQDWVNGLTTPQAIAREIFVESPIPHPTAMMHRALFERLGGYRSTPWAEDYDLWLRAFANGVRMGKPGGTWLRWRDHDGRASRLNGCCTLERFLKAKGHYLSKTVLRNRQAVLLGGGVTAARLCDALLDSGAAVAAFVDISPRRLGGQKRGRPVLTLEQAFSDWPDAAFIAAVGSRGAREKIRLAMRRHHRREGEAFWCAA